MSHKTLVNGTVYEVDGGKTLIDGVAYSIDKGKTLVGGTAYEVGFAKPLVTVTLEADLPTGYSTAEFAISYSTKDEPYGSISSAGTYELEMGTELVFTIDTRSTGEIRLNHDFNTGESEEILASGSGSVSYAYTLNGNISIKATANPMGGVFYITEE